MVVSFDGSTRIKKKCGAYSAIIWKLPEWTIVAAASEFTTDLTVNEAEYQGFLLGFDLLVGQTRGPVVICGDFNLLPGRCEVRSTAKRLVCNCYVIKPWKSFDHGSNMKIFI